MSCRVAPCLDALRCVVACLRCIVWSGDVRRRVVSRRSALSAVFVRKDGGARRVNPSENIFAQGGPLETDDLMIRIRFIVKHPAFDMKCFDKTLSDKWSERRSDKCCKLDENTSQTAHPCFFPPSPFFSECVLSVGEGGRSGETIHLNPKWLFVFIK